MKWLPELVVLELEYRLKAGELATAAEYLTRYPVLTAHAEDAVRLVAAEFRAARIHDPSVNEVMFRRRYPETGRAARNGAMGPGFEVDTATGTLNPDPALLPD